MTKSKFFVASGTLVLAIVGFMTANANRRFARATSAFFKTTATSTPLTYFKGATTSLLTTTKNSGHTAFYKTSGGVQKTLFGVKSGTSLSKTLFSVL